MLIALALPLACTFAAAQQDANQFPAASMRFLGQEMPQMETAIAERNRDYFQEAMSRVIVFSDQWGYKARDNPSLAQYSTCTDAVADFLVVGMCRIMTTSQECDPVLARTFDNNLQQCREIAAKR